MSKTKNEIRNRLTEHEANYKRCNLNLISCYNGLYPSSLSKLAIVIFTQLLSNKMYYNKDSKFYDEKEEKRIFTNVPVNPKTILENCHPAKYRHGNGDPSKDAGNVSKRITELDDNNIFYVWKCGHPKNYMFVLERDIGLWKYYNPEAYVTPKTIRKILLSTKGMTFSMFQILQEQGDNLDIHDIRNSFCAFIDGVVEKMHPDVKSKLVRWGPDKGYRDYLNTLNVEIGQLKPFEGLVENKDFYEMLPLSVFDKASPKKSKIKKHEDLAKELGPKNEDLVKRPKRKRKRKPKREQKLETWKTIEPLRDAKSFFQFYRTILSSRDENIKFLSYEIELPTASVILDLLKDNGHDKDFIISWINYFADTQLKGDNISNTNKVALRNFKSTFEEYQGRYIGCGV